MTEYSSNENKIRSNITRFDRHQQQHSNVDGSDVVSMHQHFDALNVDAFNVDESNVEASNIEALIECLRINIQCVILRCIIIRSNIQYINI